MKNNKYNKLWRELEADKKAGYPPKCNSGYCVSEDGKKCVPIKKNKAKTKKKW
jgi:hypothetical protein